MEKGEFAAKLATLKATAPRCATPDDIGLKITVTEGGGSEDQAVADQLLADWSEYLTRFLPPREDHHCPLCGAPLGGLVSHILGGGIDWSLVHGECHCRRCHYPGRAHHELKDRASISNLVLMYHPGGIDLRPEAASADLAHR